MNDKRKEYFGIARKIVSNMTTESWREIPHVVVVYGLSVRFLSGMNPLKFAKGIYPAFICAFTTTSSNCSESSAMLTLIVACPV